MNYVEKIHALRNIIGPQVAELPRDWDVEAAGGENWNGPKCIVFWADAQNEKLQAIREITVNIHGPFEQDNIPFSVFNYPPSTGYLIFVELD